jgi:hypothetical protein
MLKTLTSCGIIITFVFGIWFIDERYISAKELSNEKQKIYLKMNVSEYRTLTEQYYNYKKIVKENPNDVNLKSQFDEIIKDRDKVKEKIDNFMENGK